MSEAGESELDREVHVEAGVLGETAARYMPAIVEISGRAFEGDVLDFDEIESALKNPRSAVSILKENAKGEVVGYALAVPTNKADTAHYVANAILPEWQGKKLVGKLSESIEDQLRAAGFVFVTRETRTRGGYADVVRKAYQGRIMGESSVKNAVGDAISFRIQL